MKLKTITICMCLIILMFGIMFKYATWRDTEFLTQEEVVERTKTFEEIK